MSNKNLIKVKAKFTYQRQNEDELSFTKGATFYITKKEEGGWWEGSYNGKVGWFPSNYVKELKISTKKSVDESVMNNSHTVVDIKALENKEAYYQQVLKNLIETEHNYVKQLETLVGDYLKPLHPQTASGSEGIPASDIHLLNANLPALVNFQVSFLQQLEEIAKKAVSQQTIGLCFVKNGDTLRTIYEEYCSNHPSIVVVLQTHKEYLSSYIESKGIAAQGIVHLTSLLSLPFRHLENYPSQLRELERHMLEDHQDVVDLARAITQYETYFVICQETRKRKETIQHILSSNIAGWEGDPISSLGPVVYMSAIRFFTGPVEQDKKDKFLLLFPSVLLVLSASPRMSAFIHEGRLPLTVLQSQKLVDTADYQHAFELTGTLIDRKVVITRSAEEQRRWLQVLETQCEQCKRSSAAPVAASPIVTKAPVTQIPHAPKHTGTNPPVRKTPEHISPTASPPPFPLDKNAAPAITGEKKNYRLTLRPAPPMRQCISNSKEHSSQSRSKSPKPNLRKSRHQTKTTSRFNQKVFDEGRLEDEQKVFDVLKFYCNAMSKKGHKSYITQTRARQPSILDEKIIMEDPENDTRIEEKSLVDAVYELKDQVATLMQEQKRMQKNMEEENKARKKLENLIRRAAKDGQKSSTLPNYATSTGQRKHLSNQ